MIKSKAKRAFIISDTHLGMRSNNVDWLNMASDWFEENFIPTVKKLYKPGDILIHTGDVFDNRQSINILVLNKAISIFEELSKIFDDIIIIAGNHDVMRKTSNEVSSLDSLKYIPNLRILKEPEIIELEKTSLLMMPWRTGLKEERECIKEFYNPSIEYLFCHTNILNLNFDKVVKIQDGLNEDDLKGFKRVYSGHIHRRQEMNNVYMIGNPYEMTRSDRDNVKGWYILDFESGEHEFMENKTSPKFKRIYLDRMLECTMETLKEECSGNRVDLYIPNKYHLQYYNINPILEAISSVCKTLDVISYDRDNIQEIEGDVESEGNFNILLMSNTYINSLNHVTPTVKKRAIKKIEDLYNEIIRG